MTRLLLLLTFLSATLQARPRWLPPVQVSKTTQVGDTAVWQLVFSEDFNVDQLDTTRWNSFTSWKGMELNVNGKKIKGDHDQWRGARPSYENAIYTKENIIVKNGVCKLLMRNQTYSWHCKDCTDGDTVTTKGFTAAIITTPYQLRPNGIKNSFNNGRFEARLRLPTHPDAWAGMWTWFGTQVNELDIVEAYGRQDRWNKINAPLATFNYHAWAPPAYRNKDSLPENVYIENSYPQQNWWNMLSGKGLNQGEWHIYTCEWDTATIKIFLDHELVNTQYKYFQPDTFIYSDGFENIKYAIRRPADSLFSPGLWQITEGYPYFSNSESQLRFNTSFLPTAVALADTTFTVASMEIDYVKIWQRNREQGSFLTQNNPFQPENEAENPRLIFSDSIQKSENSVKDKSQNDKLPVFFAIQTFWPKGRQLSFGNASTEYRKGSWTINYLDKKGEKITIQESGAFISLPGFPRRRDVPKTVYYEYTVYDNLDTLSYTGSIKKARWSKAYVADPSIAYYESELSTEQLKVYEARVTHHVSKMFFTKSMSQASVSEKIRAARLAELAWYLKLE